MQSGMDSLAALELRNKIQARFGIEMPATVTFDHPNIEALAYYISDRMSLAQARPLYSAGARPSAKHVRGYEQDYKRFSWMSNVPQS